MCLCALSHTGSVNSPRPDGGGRQSQADRSLLLTHQRPEARRVSRAADVSLCTLLTIGINPTFRLSDLENAEKTAPIAAKPEKPENYKTAAE